MYYNFLCTCITVKNDQVMHQTERGSNACISYSTIYIALNIYILIWLIRWLKACHGFFHKKWVHAVIIILYALAAFSMLAGLIDLPTGLHRLAKHVENYWLGFLLYIIFVVAIADLIKVIVKTIYRKKGLDQTRLRSRRTFVVSGAVCMIHAAIGVYGMVNAGCHTDDGLRHHCR